MKIEFNEKTHRYYVDGKPVPSVTTVLGILDKPGLNIWRVQITIGWIGEHLPELRAEDLTVERAIEILKEAEKWHEEKAKMEADIGKKIHELLHLYLLGEKVYIEEMEDRVKKGFEGAVKWLESKKFKAKAIEEKVVHPVFLYAGTFDTIGKMDGKVALIDWKSTEVVKNGKEKPVYSEMKIQPVCYAKAWEKMHAQTIDEIWVVRLDKNTGDFYPHLISEEERKASFQIFLACLSIYNARKILK